MKKDIYENNQAIVDFYLNGGVDKIIRKYDFSDSELDILLRAKRTARHKHPNMELIKKADNLLSIAVKVRKPKYEEKIDQQEIAKGILAAENLEREAKNLELQKEKKKLFKIILFVLSTIISYALSYYIQKKYGFDLGF